ncbi:MAG: helix-turn-helix domain-containing protein [Nocardiopsaceae bacterium]|nr:helix-turn-helix domain-containing protein [Nocardiopsaceae bacterium]
MATIGHTLATAREQSGYALAELSARTCIRKAILAAMENDDFSPCGGDFYARGHIRAVCKELGTDPEPLIERFERDGDRPRPKPSFPDRAVLARPWIDRETEKGPKPSDPCEHVHVLTSEEPQKPPAFLADGDAV